MSELPDTKEGLLHEMSRGGSGPSSEATRQIVRAALDSLLIGELTSGLAHLTTSLSQARDEMRYASEATAKYTQALVRATRWLAVLTGVLAVATVISLFK